MTSAPRSARIDEANGPGTNIEKSITWMPASGSQGSDMRWLDPVVERDAAVDHHGRAGDVGAKALGEDGERHGRHVGRRAEASQRNLLHHAGRRIEASARNRTGRDGIDANAARAERSRELLHEHRLARLGGAVVRQIPRRLGMQRRREKHAPLDALLDHLAAKHLAQHERRIEVHCQHFAPLRLAHFEHSLAFLPARARAMHEKRHAAQPVDRLLRQAPGALRGGKIAADVRIVDDGAEHLRAFFLERQRHAAADAARAAGDECMLAFQQFHLSPALARLAARRSRLFAVSTTKRTCLPRPHSSIGSRTENSNVTRRRSISTILTSIVTLSPSGVAARWSIDTCAPTESSPASSCWRRKSRHVYSTSLTMRGVAYTMPSLPMKPMQRLSSTVTSRRTDRPTARLAFMAPCSPRARSRA